MAVTYSATPMGAYRSALRNSLVSIAAAGTEAMTLVHMLGACPTEIRCMLRSQAVATSGMPMVPPAICVLNASQAMLYFGVGARGEAGTAYIDLICEVTHSIVS